MRSRVFRFARFASFLRIAGAPSCAWASRALMVTGTAAAAATLVACSEPRPESNATRPAPAAPHAATPQAPISDGGVAIDDAAAGPYEGPYIGGLFAATPIMSDMEWPIKDGELRPGEKQRSFRIGYIRQGAKVPVIPEAHKKPNCLDGWYELVQGGFVCGKYASLDLNHPKIRTAPHLADLTGALPFQYWINLSNGTPLYKHLPSRDERIRFEPWLTRKPKPPPAPTHPREDEDPEATSALDLQPVANAPAAAASTTADPLGIGTGEDVDAGVPWYLRDYDGGKPPVTLDDLTADAEDGGPLEKRMVKGFYASLDKDETHNGNRWWRTQTRLYTPYNRIYLAKPMTEFHGVWLNQDPPTVGAWGAPSAEVTADAGLPPIRRIDKLPIGFVVASRAKKYMPSDDGKKMVAGDHVGRYAIMGLTGQTRVVDHVLYRETDEGWWMRAYDGTATDPGPPPKDLAAGEKWIDVNLKN